MPFYDPETMEQKLAGASYSTSEGVWVDGERVIFGVINKPGGTGSRPHRHPNEQFILVQQGSLQAMIDGERKTVGAGGIIHIPANSLHSMVATDDEDVIFIVAKDTAWQIEGVAEDDSAYGAYIGEGADESVAARFRDIAEQGPESGGNCLRLAGDERRKSPARGEGQGERAMRRYSRVIP